MINRARQLWRRLTEPSSALSEFDQQRSRLLSSLFLAILILGASLQVMGILLILTTSYRDAIPLIQGGLAAAGVLLVLYFLSRSRFYRLAIWILMPTLMLMILLSAAASQRMEDLYLLVVLLILSTVLLRLRTTVILAAIILGTTFFFGMVVFEATLTEIFYAVGASLIFTIFILLLVAYQNDRIQRIREQQLIAHEQQYRQELEREVAERTRDLERVNQDLLEEIDLRASVEQELRKRSEQDALLMDLSPVGILLIADNQVSYANRAAQRMLGVDEGSQLAGLEVARIVPWPGSTLDDTPVSRQDVKAMLLGQTPEILMRLDGSTFDVDFSAASIPHTEPPLILVIFQDITDKKMAEQALRDREERYRQLVALLPDGVTVSREGVWDFANEAAAYLLGYSSPGELLGSRSMDHTYSEDRERARQRIEDLERSGAPLPFVEERLVRKDGSILVTESASFPFVEHGEVAVQTVFRDITDRKERERRLRALSQLVLRLQEQERRHVARELHDEIGQSLTALKYALENAERTAGEEAIDSLRDAKTQLAELMNQVRTMSLELRPPMLDDLGLIPCMLWYFDRYTQRTGINVTFNHSGIDRRFPSDVEITVFRVVQECLTNAARYARTDEVAVEIYQHNDQIVTCVEDDGVGFNPDSSLRTKATGGLSGMKERVRLISGELNIHSQVGDGTRVEAKIPASIEASS